MSNEGETGKEVFAELEEAIKSKDFQGALRMLQGLKAFMSDRPEISLLQAKCYIGLGRPLDALSMLKNLDVEESQETSRLDLLRIAYETLFLDELAIETARRIIETGEGSEEVYCSLSGILLAGGSAGEAVAAANEGLDKFPSSESLKLSLGLCHVHQKEREKAVELLRELEAKGSSLAPDLASALEQDDDRPLKEKRDKLHQEAQEHLLRAVEQMKKGDIGGAVRELVKGLHKDPTLAIAYTRLGYLCDNIGLSEEGFILHRRALELDPNLAEAHSNIGYGLQKKGDFREAIAAFEKALELDPLNVEAHNSIGVMYDNLGKYDKGLEHFKTALSINPKHASTLINLSFAYRTMGKFDEAIPLLEDAALLRPDFATRLTLASAYRQGGRLEDARSLLTSLAESDPESLPAALELALCHHDSGDAESFCAAAGKAASLKPRKPTELFKKAQVMELLDKRFAVECWKEYVNFAGHPSAQGGMVSYARDRIGALETSIKEDHPISLE